jgi:bile acid:Na+ symporter, BASS family
MFESYPEYEYLLASSQLAFAMLGMGALLSPADFVREIHHPRPLLLGLSIQMLLVPLLALGFVSVVPLPAGLAAGILLVAIVPGGTLSNIYTYVGRGNIALSISLTSITTVATLLTAPLLITLLLASYSPDNAQMPVAKVSKDIFLALLLPLCTGMLIRALYFNVSQTLSKWSIRISLTLVLCIVIGALGSGRLNLIQYGFFGFFSVILFTLLLLGVSTLLTTLTALKVPDRAAISIEATLRNANLAVAIKATLFPATVGQLDPIGDAVLFCVLLYGGSGMLISMAPMYYYRSLATKNEQAISVQPSVIRQDP